MGSLSASFNYIITLNNITMEEEIKTKPLSKYIVLKKTSEGLPKSHWIYIALIDRNKSKEHWRTVDFNDAFKFISKKIADAKAKSLKYGPCITIEASQFYKYVGREFYKVKINVGLSKELSLKEHCFDGDDVSYDNYQAAKDEAISKWGYDWKEHIEEYL